MLSDGELHVSQLNIEIARALRAAGPWGQGFPMPLFDGRFKLISYRIVGQKHMKITLQVIDSEIMLDAILFNYENYDWQSRADIIHIAYELDVNFFRGIESVQLMIRHIETITQH
jgi:single-stranded-DNA-specific exonuclease